MKEKTLGKRKSNTTTATSCTDNNDINNNSSSSSSSSSGKYLCWDETVVAYVLWAGPSDVWFSQLSQKLLKFLSHAMYAYLCISAYTTEPKIKT